MFYFHFVFFSSSSVSFVALIFSGCSAQFDQVSTIHQVFAGYMKPDMAVFFLQRA